MYWGSYIKLDDEQNVSVTLKKKVRTLLTECHIFYLSHRNKEP